MVRLQVTGYPSFVTFHFLLLLVAFTTIDNQRITSTMIDFSQLEVTFDLLIAIRGAIAHK